MKYKFVSALTIALLSQVSWGQSTAQYTHESKTLQKALSLYYQKQYKASSHFLEKSYDELPHKPRRSSVATI